ncbi:MAG: AgmX/PglI C-terminal domain-containing protein [Deltaproteobacteria bacterium]|nr:AgmX/PglI C-terminal domain-containing protein [Deltaproteobacteria bacterium]
MVMFVGAGVLSAMSRNTWRIFQESGWFAWLELLAALFGLLVLAVLGALLTLKPGAWSWPLVIPGGLVTLVAALGMQISMGKVRGAISGESVDPSQKARIFAMGFAECLGLIIIGGLLASLLLSAASVVCSTRALARVNKRELGSGPLAALGAGVVLFIAVIAVRVLFSRGQAGPPFELLAAGSGVLAVVIASSAMWGSPQESEGHSRAAGDVMVAALLAAGGVLVASLGARGYSLAMAFSAVAGESVDPSQKARILAQGFTEANASTLWGALFVVPVFGAALLPLMMRTGHAAKGIGFAWGGMLGVVLGSALAVAMPRLQSDRTMNSLPDMWKVDLQPGLQLVEVSTDARLDGVAGAVLCVGKDRVTVNATELGPSSKLDSEAGCTELMREATKHINTYADLLVAVDSSVPFSRMSCLSAAWQKLSASGPESRARPHWVVKDPVGPTTKLAPPFDKMISGLGATRERDRFSSTRPTVRHVHVAKARLTLARAAGEEPARKEGDLAAQRAWLRTMVDGSMELSLTAEPDLPASAILPIVADHRGVAIGAATTSEIPPELEAPPEPPPTTSSKDSSIRGGAMTVSGRLPPEVIQKIVRQQNPRLRQCYEQGLARNPNLQGRVSIRFVIDREGKVANVGNGGSDLPDDKVVQCVVKAFYKMQFPQPEGGIVTVIYPIVFTSAK